MLKDYQDYYSHFPDNRVKERRVDDALKRVRDWRRIYEQSLQEECRKNSRITLQEAAQIVKIPKKTLEDYIQIFNKVSLIRHIEDFSDKKMGFLRAFIRKNKAKIRKAALIRKQKQQDSIDVKTEGSFSDKIKIEFENSQSIDVKEEQQIYDLNSDVKLEESYSNSLFYCLNKF